MGEQALWRFILDFILRVDIAQRLRATEGPLGAMGKKEDNAAQTSG